MGVCRGEFSNLLLQGWPGFLFLVDPWENLPDYAEFYDQLDNFEAMLETVKPYSDRCEVFRMTSRMASERFADGTLDFVYLDANHAYKAVQEDLEAWWPKIKSGGILAGDDYGPFPETEVDFGHGRVKFGVRRAVDEFAIKYKKNVSIDLLAQWDAAGFQARNFWLCK